MIKQIIVGPQITEKSMSFAPEKRYIFEVSKEANKPEIANAIEKLYKVKVLKVTTISIKGKTVKFKQRYSGKRKDRKKAIVRISKNQTIKDFVVKE